MAAAAVVVELKRTPACLPEELVVDRGHVVVVMVLDDRGDAVVDAEL